MNMKQWKSRLRLGMELVALIAFIVVGGMVILPRALPTSFSGEEALTELVQFSGKDDRDAPRKAVALAVFLASQESDRITGKLLAAQHDDWLRISKTEGIHPSAYTMRRIDSYTLRQLNAQWDLDALGEGN